MLRERYPGLHLKVNISPCKFHCVDRFRSGAKFPYRRSPTFEGMKPLAHWHAFGFSNPVNQTIHKHAVLRWFLPVAIFLFIYSFFFCILSFLHHKMHLFVSMSLIGLALAGPLRSAGGKAAEKRDLVSEANRRLLKARP